MKNSKKESVSISIDIGTTKICVLVAQKKPDNRIDILGMGRSPSYGLKKGVVVDIAKTVQSIKNAVKEAEFVSGVTIEEATVGISGSHIHSFNSHGAAPINKGYVKPSDVINTLSAARAIAIPEGQQILHVLPKYYVIDNGDKIMDPIGMAGIRLEAEVHIITGSIASVQNIVRCCEMAGVQTTDIVLEQLASAYAVLSPDEKELGIGVLDIGGGTADFAVYQQSSIRHTKVFPIAGNQFTNDVAIGLQTTITDAQEIKEKYGIAHKSLLKHNLELSIHTVEGLGQKNVKHSDLLNILYPRSEEIMSLLNEEITRQHLKPLMTTGLVITGGGSLLAGIDLVAQEVLKIPIRIGKPNTQYVLPDSLDNPMYATGYGLLMHAFDEQKKRGLEYFEGPLTKKILLKMKSWVSDFF